MKKVHVWLLMFLSHDHNVTKLLMKKIILRRQRYQRSPWRKGQNQIRIIIITFLCFQRFQTDVNEPLSEVLPLMIANQEIHTSTTFKSWSVSVPYFLASTYFAVSLSLFISLYLLPRRLASHHHHPYHRRHCKMLVHRLYSWLHHFPTEICASSVHSCHSISSPSVHLWFSLLLNKILFSLFHLLFYIHLLIKHQSSLHQSFIFTHHQHRASCPPSRIMAVIMVNFSSDQS